MPRKEPRSPSTQGDTCGHVRIKTPRESAGRMCDKHDNMVSDWLIRHRFWDVIQHWQVIRQKPGLFL